MRQDGLRVLGSEEQGIAIRVRGCGRFCAELATRTGAVFDDECLAQSLLKSIRRNARNGVWRGSWAIRNDDANGLGGIGVCIRHGWHGTGGNRQQNGGEWLGVSR